jgi:hypothetical protein
VARPTNLINNPIGFGVIISIITLISVFYVLYKYRFSLAKPGNRWRIITLFWLVFTFLGVNGITFNIFVAYGAFRVWMLMAIPIALISCEGISFIFERRKSIYLWMVLSAVLVATNIYINNIGASFPFIGGFFTISIIASLANLGVLVFNHFSENKISINSFSYITVIFIFFAGILLTSGYQKYEVNTALWPTAGAFSGGHPTEPFEYAKWFNSIPKNTKVFLYSPRGKIVIGFDAYSCAWCDDIISFRENILNKNVTELYSFLKMKGYQYMVLGRMDSKYLAKDEESTELLNKRQGEILSSSLFTPVHHVEGMMVALRVN